MAVSSKTQETYIELLKTDLMLALGCTEPIAVAYATAKAKEVLGDYPDRMEVLSSGNIIKNVKAVTVPHSGGQKGIDVAAVLGAIGGNPDLKLEVLESVTKEHIAKANELLKDPNYCKCGLIKSQANLDIIATLYKGEESALVEIKNYHTNIVRIEKNGKSIFVENSNDVGESTIDKGLLNLRDILEFASTVDLNLVKDILDMQIEANKAISEEGLTNEWGINVGAMVKELGDDVMFRAAAAAAAGSDARMSGCDLPVVTNSGSGNQGITVSMPVIMYAEELGVSQEKLYRALLVSNLLAMHQKRFIGSLSAYCGAVSAGCAAGAAIVYLQGGDYDAIANTITNTLATTGGIVCDGAKPSCASKIATSLIWAITAGKLAMAGRYFKPGEGLVGDTVEDTIMNYGRMAKYGMKSTDEEILLTMLGEPHKE